MSHEIIRRVDYYSRRGQELILLLSALWEMGGINSKNETIAFINESGWINITKYDLPAYEGQNEPRYHTLLAWARKDGVLNDWVSYSGRDCWGITRDGRIVLDTARDKFRKQEWHVSSCYLWTHKFKLINDPEYAPSKIILKIQ